MAPLRQTDVHADAVPGPRPGQLVRLHGCNQRRCTAKVARVAPRSIEVHVVDGDADAIRELVEAPTVAVEFLSSEAMNRLYASAHLYTGADGTSLFLLPRGGTQVLGRRKHMRTDLDAVIVLQNRTTDEHVDGWVVNLGVGGMLADRLSEPVEHGRTYGFSIVPAGSADSITGTASVVRVESPRRAALQVGLLAHPSVDELIRFLFEEAEMRRASR